MQQRVECFDLDLSNFESNFELRSIEFLPQIRSILGFALIRVFNLEKGRIPKVYDIF